MKGDTRYFGEIFTDHPRELDSNEENITGEITAEFVSSRGIDRHSAVIYYLLSFLFYTTRTEIYAVKQFALFLDKICLTESRFLYVSEIEKDLYIKKKKKPQYPLPVDITTTRIQKMHSFSG